MRRGGEPCPEAARAVADAMGPWARGLGVTVHVEGATLHVIGPEDAMREVVEVVENAAASVAEVTHVGGDVGEA